MTPFEVVLEAIELAKAWGESEALLPRLLPIQDAVVNRLETAGFEQLNVFEQGCVMTPQSGTLVTWARQRWKHPDCEMPFVVEVSLHVLWGGNTLGLSYFQVWMHDDAGLPGEHGILHNNPYQQQMRLTTKGGFTSAQEWSTRLEDAWKNVDLAEVGRLADRVLTHLESVTTP